ncbi:MAG: ABC transporter ATP-binding protein [Acidimicrobiia bacterium]|nr:ABC transporter ATP-binding protein [Acidimicrobiia bacterium]
MADRPAIVVDDVSKRFRLYHERASSLKERVTRLRQDRYEEFWALRNVSLEVPEGSVFALVGHNGSGKSTLLRTMCGIYRPTSGRIQIDGRISPLLELGAGFHPDLSGRENVYLNASILGLSRREIDAIFDDVVAFSGLEKFIDSPVKVYSSGMYVRLGFSVAVHVNPQILLVDEVIAVGDEEFQRRCFEHLYKLRTNGVTIVLVSHGLTYVQTMCDQAAWLDHGELQVAGAAAEVAEAYLSQVNAAEVERIESVEEGEQPQSSAVVSGPGGDDVSLHPIRIREIEVLDDKGERTHVVDGLSPVRVRIHYRASEVVDNPRFAFTFKNDGEVPLAGPSYHPDQPGVGIVPVGDGYVDYVIDHLPLSPGEYHLNAVVRDRHSMIRFDHVQGAYDLRVHPSGRSLTGLVDLRGRWEYQS